MDIFKTHKLGVIYETFEPINTKRLWNRFEIVYTTKHGSWLNMNEIKFHIPNDQCLRWHIPTIEEVENEVVVWQECTDKLSVYN